MISSKRDIDRVIVGGSGLYVEAVVRGYKIADVEPKPALREALDHEPHQALVDWLREEAPHLVDSTDLTNKKRVIRALEIAAAERDGPVQFSEPLGIIAQAVRNGRSFQVCLVSL